ncbi:hypothetical protein ACFL5C_01375, partial [Candidatus Omnitrophota bacterium]
MQYGFNMTFPDIVDFSRREIGYYITFISEGGGRYSVQGKTDKYGNMSSTVTYPPGDESLERVVNSVDIGKIKNVGEFIDALLADRSLSPTAKKYIKENEEGFVKDFVGKEGVENLKGHLLALARPLANLNNFRSNKVIWLEIRYELKERAPLERWYDFWSTFLGAFSGLFLASFLGALSSIFQTYWKQASEKGGWRKLGAFIRAFIKSFAQERKRQEKELRKGEEARRKEEVERMQDIREREEKRREEDQRIEERRGAEDQKRQQRRQEEDQNIKEERWKEDAQDEDFIQDNALLEKRREEKSKNRAEEDQGREEARREEDQRIRDARREEDRRTEEGRTREDQRREEDRVLQEARLEEDRQIKNNRREEDQEHDRRYREEEIRDMGDEHLVRNEALRRERHQQRDRRYREENYRLEDRRRVEDYELEQARREEDRAIEDQRRQEDRAAQDSRQAADAGMQQDREIEDRRIRDDRARENIRHAQDYDLEQRRDELDQLRQEAHREEDMQDADLADEDLRRANRQERERARQEEDLNIEQQRRIEDYELEQARRQEDHEIENQRREEDGRRRTERWHEEDGQRLEGRREEDEQRRQRHQAEMERMQAEVAERVDRRPEEDQDGQQPPRDQHFEDLVIRPDRPGYMSPDEWNAQDAQGRTGLEKIAAEREEANPDCYQNLGNIGGVEFKIDRDLSGDNWAEDIQTVINALRNDGHLTHAPPKPIKIVSLSRSPHLGEDCKSNGLIGINLAVTSRDLRKLIIYHEMLHEINPEMPEEDVYNLTLEYISSSNFDAGALIDALRGIIVLEPKEGRQDVIEFLRREKKRQAEAIRLETDRLREDQDITARREQEDQRANQLARAGQALPAVPQGRRTVSDDTDLDTKDLLETLKLSMKEIDDWVDKIGADFRMKGVQEEKMGIFFPYLRRNEPWEFFDPAAAPRHNLNILWRSLAFVAVTAVLTMSGYSGLIHIAPYMYLFWMSGLLNWIKRSSSIMLGGIFVLLQHYIPVFVTQIPLTYVSLVITTLAVAYYVGRLFYRYYDTVSRPEGYIRRQKDQLRILDSVLTFITNGDPSLARAIEAESVGRASSIDEFVEAILADESLSDVARNYIRRKKENGNFEKDFKDAKKKRGITEKEYLKDLKKRLSALARFNVLRPQIEDLTRFKRSRNDWGTGKPYEGGSVVRTPQFGQILDNAINETRKMLADAPTNASLRARREGYRRWGWITAALASFAILGVDIAQTVWSFSPTVWIISVAAIIVSAMAILAVSVGRRARELTLFHPARDMKNIYRDYQRLLYSKETGENLKAIDVRRFLVETRAALNRAMETRQTVTKGQLRQSLDEVKTPLVNVRDTTTVRDYKDTFHLTRLEQWPRKIAMLLRVVAWLSLFGFLAYAGTIIGIVGLREVASLITGGGFLGYGQLFEHPFALTEIVKFIIIGQSFHTVAILGSVVLLAGIAFMYFSYQGGRTAWRSYTADTITSFLMAVSALLLLVSGGYYWELPKLMLYFLGQTFIGTIILASLVLFAFKFSFSFLGMYARRSPADRNQEVFPRHYYYAVGGILLSAAAFVSVTLVGASWPVLFVSGVQIVSALALFCSAAFLWIIHTARDRFKAIDQDDKLYQGDDRVIRADSYGQFVKTIMGKYTQEDLEIIRRANIHKRGYEDLKERCEREGRDCPVENWKQMATQPTLIQGQTNGSWRGVTSLNHSEIKRYETLFGKGAEPSGEFTEDFSRSIPRDAGDGPFWEVLLERAYMGLSAKEIIRRMSGTGFKELMQHLHGRIAALTIQQISAPRGYVLTNDDKQRLRNMGLTDAVLNSRMAGRLRRLILIEDLTGVGLTGLNDDEARRLARLDSEIRLKRYLYDRLAKLTLWGVQKTPSLLTITADGLRDFLETSYNEKKIVVMYDFLPKFTPWIVVVGGEKAVFHLIQSLLAFRYPLEKLKFIFAGENWDVPVQDEVLEKKKNGAYPPQLIFRGMAIREDGRLGEPSQPYTKPGANTAVLHESDGVAGVIYDAENVPNPNQILELVLGTMDGIASLRHLIETRLNPALDNNWNNIAEDDGVETLVDSARRSVEDTVDEYMAAIKPGDIFSAAGRDLSLHYQFNFKQGSILKRHLRYFANHALRTLFELTGGQRDSLYFSTAMIWKRIEEKIGDETPEGQRERRELINLYITLCNMPGYGDLATRYMKGEITKDEFIRGMVIGEFRRINEPRNGQGRLAKINSALHRSKGQAGAFMYGEYASWYTAGWDGFHAAQDTFKPLGGTTGYFCTEPVEEINWKDDALRELLDQRIEVVKDDERKYVTCREFIVEHYKTKNKLLTLGAWDEYQVAEDYMLGYVSWLYGFNIAGFYSLTPEDPAGFESELSFKFRPKQMSRWNKGYDIGLLISTEGNSMNILGNMAELYERKGLWGLLVFFVPTLCSAIHPLTFSIAKVITYFWWIYWIPVIVLKSEFLSSVFKPLLEGPVALWFNNLTGLGTLLADFHAGLSSVAPQLLNFLPAGWAWGIGPLIVIVPIFIHRFFTMRGIIRGVNDYLGRQRVLEDYDKMIGDKFITTIEKLKGDLLTNTLKPEIEKMQNEVFDGFAVRRLRIEIEKLKAGLPAGLRPEERMLEEMKINWMSSALDDLKKEFDGLTDVGLKNTVGMNKEDREEHMKKWRNLRGAIKARIKTLEQGLTARHISSTPAVVGGFKTLLAQNTRILSELRGFREDIAILADERFTAAELRPIRRQTIRPRRFGRSMELQTIDARRLRRFVRMLDENGVSDTSIIVGALRGLIELNDMKRDFSRMLASRTRREISERNRGRVERKISIYIARIRERLRRQNIDEIVGGDISVNVDTMEEMAERRRIIRSGSLEETPGVISPRPYTLGIGLLLGAGAAAVFPNAWSLFLPGIYLSSTVVALFSVALAAILLWHLPRPRISRGVPLAWWRGVSYLALAAAGAGSYFSFFIAAKVAVTLIATISLYAGIMGLGRWYIAGARHDAIDIDVERSVRAMRFRGAIPNFFIDMYHTLYLDGSWIAWHEVINGGRIGYWWRTPRTVAIDEEAYDRQKAEKIKRTLPRQTRYFTDLATITTRITIDDGDLKGTDVVVGTSNRIVDIRGNKVRAFRIGRNGRTYIRTEEEDPLIKRTPLRLMRWGALMVANYYTWGAFATLYGVSLGANWALAAIMAILFWAGSATLTTGISLFAINAAGRFQYADNETLLGRLFTTLFTGELEFDYIVEVNPAGKVVVTKDDDDTKFLENLFKTFFSVEELEWTLEQKRLFFQRLKHYGFMIFMFLFIMRGVISNLWDAAFLMQIKETVEKTTTPQTYASAKSEEAGRYMYPRLVIPSETDQPAAGTRIPKMMLPDKGLMRNVGVNVPWINYGRVDFNSPETKKILNEWFRALSEAGLTKTRIFLFAGDAPDLKLHKGKITLDSRAYEGIKTLRAAAKTYGIELTTVIFNHDLQNADWFKNNKKSEMLKQIIIGLINNPDYLAGAQIEVFNEAVVMKDIKEGRHHDVGIDAKKLPHFRIIKKFVLDIAKEAEKSKTGIVISCLGLEDLMANWADAETFMTENIILHLHIYDKDPVRAVKELLSAKDLRERIKAEIKEKIEKGISRKVPEDVLAKILRNVDNLKIEIGEVGAYDADRKFEQLNQDQVYKILQFLREKGYEGVVFWQDARYNFDLDMLRPVKAEAEAQPVKALTPLGLITVIMAAVLFVPFLLSLFAVWIWRRVRELAARFGAKSSIGKPKKQPISWGGSAIAGAFFGISAVVAGHFFGPGLAVDSLFFAAIIYLLQGFELTTGASGLIKEMFTKIMPRRAGPELIKPFRNALPAEKGEIAYTVKDKLYVNAEEMRRRPAFIQYFYYFHEWIHLKFYEWFRLEGILSEVFAYTIIGLGLVSARAIPVIAAGMLVSVLSGVAIDLMGNMHGKYVMAGVSPFLLAGYFVGMQNGKEEAQDVFENITDPTEVEKIILEKIKRDRTLFDAYKDTLPEELRGVEPVTVEFAERCF